MEDQERVLMVIASRMLLYPSDNFFEECKSWNDYMRENITSIELQQDLRNVFSSLDRYALREIRELYVTTFDLDEKNALYLTAQELGDSTKRGAALIKLQKLINKAGFERVDDELADFIPMLLEFLA